MYFLGICLYIRSMTEDIKGALDKIFEAKSMNRLDAKELERELAANIKFHNDIIEYVSNSSGVN